MRADQEQETCVGARSQWALAACQDDSVEQEQRLQNRWKKKWKNGEETENTNDEIENDIVEEDSQQHTRSKRDTQQTLRVPVLRRIVKIRWGKELQIRMSREKEEILISAFLKNWEMPSWNDGAASDLLKSLRAHAAQKRKKLKKKTKRRFSEKDAHEWNEETKQGIGREARKLAGSPRA